MSISPAVLSRRTIAPLVLLSLLLNTGCSLFPKEEAQAQSQSAGQQESKNVAVETAIAQAGSLTDVIEYTGTTTPYREVSLRSQTEGRLVDLNVDVGDSVRRGEVLGQVDNRLLLALVNQERAELAALQSEVAQAEAEVSDARAQVQQAQIELQQAQADADRLQSLAGQGAVTTQSAEQALTAARSAEQAVRSAEEQVRTRQQAVVAAQGRVSAQRATLAEVEQRKAYASLNSPIGGAVLERLAEPGDLVQPGDEVLTLGDFSSLKVVVQVSELELGNLRVGQSAQVRLDAYPDQEFRGEIRRISPAADPTARLVPIEIVIPNSDNRIGSGLLARVQFQSNQAERVIVPEQALEVAGKGNDSVVFLVEKQGDTAKAVARQVQVGDRANGQVEIRSGLEPGEAFIVRSSQSLKEGQPVQLSILSETESQSQTQSQTQSESVKPQ